MATKPQNSTSNNSSKVKTTVMLDRKIKKLAQIYALEHDISLGDVIEQALDGVVLK